MSDKTLSLIPHLTCRGAEEAAEFYCRAFGAEQLSLMKTPDGKVMHAALDLQGATIFLVDEFPDFGALGPQSIGGSPVTLHLHVPDCDAVFQRAVEAGCQVHMPLAEQFWGDRYGSVVDPYGHHWSIATTVRQLSPEELQQAAASGGCGAG
jgi:PhnB protein